jgi:polar amino acid transport system substrate-binding protein
MNFTAGLQYRFGKGASAAGVLLVLACALASGCGGSAGSGTAAGAQGSGDTALEHLRQAGFARIAIANEPPYTKVNTDGTVTGAEPDLARAVFKTLGVKSVQGVVTPYDSMIPGLVANRWDVITAGLFMNSQRCSQVAYSDPQIVSTQSFAVPQGNPKNLTSLDQLKQDSSLKVGVQTADFNYQTLTKQHFPKSRIVQFPDLRSAIEGLAAGRVDVVFEPTLSLNELKGGSKFEVTPPVKGAPITGSGTAFRKSDTALRDAYNQGLDKLKKTGEFDRILKKWGFSGSAARSVTTAQLCKTPG